MRKRSRKVFSTIFLLMAVILFCVFSIKLSEWILVKKISSVSSGVVTIDSISLRFPSILVKKIKVRTPAASVFLGELRVKPLFIRNAFAFSGPGDILLNEKKRDISIKGSLSGNFKGQTINVNKTLIKIDKIGGFEVKGFLENWGRNGFNTTVEFKGIEIEEIKQIFDLKLPFSGRVFGKADFVSEEKGKTRKITFDVNIKDLATSEHEKFEASVKGIYNIADGSAEIYRGNIFSPAGGRISFSGIIDKEKFNLNFETDNMNVEEFLKLLPAKIKEKYNLETNGGNAEMKDFKIGMGKKNSGLTVFCQLMFRKSPFWV